MFFWNVANHVNDAAGKASITQVSVTGGRGKIRIHSGSRRLSPVPLPQPEVSPPSLLPRPSPQGFPKSSKRL